MKVGITYRQIFRRTVIRLVRLLCCRFAGMVRRMKVIFRIIRAKYAEEHTVLRRVERESPPATMPTTQRLYRLGKNDFENLAFSRFRVKSEKA